MHSLGVLSGVVFMPSTIGEAIASEVIQTIAIVMDILPWLLCLAY